MYPAGLVGDAGTTPGTARRRQQQPGPTQNVPINQLLADPERRKLNQQQLAT